MLKTAIARAVIYLVPILLGVLATALVGMGFGVYDEAAGTYTFTVKFSTVAAYIAAMIGGGGTALTALLAGWKSRL